MVVTVKVPDPPSVKVVARSRGDRRRRVHRQGEALGGVGAHPVVGRDDQEGRCPPVPPAGVPDRVAVLSPLSTKVTPVGSVPRLGQGAVGQSPSWSPRSCCRGRSVKVASSADVMTGAAVTVRRKLWVASEPTPLPAVMVTGRCRRCPPPGCPPGWRCRHRCRRRSRPTEGSPVSRHRRRSGACRRGHREGAACPR